MKQRVTEIDPITVSIIVSKEQLHWRSLEFFIDGLSSALVMGEVYVAPNPSAHREPRLFSWLIALENLVLPKGRVKHGAVTGRALPTQAEEIALCDVILDFRPGLPDAEVRKRARFGVWTFSSSELGGLTKEVAQGASAVECLIYAQAGDDDQRRCIASMIVQSKHALSSTLTFAREKSVQLALRELNRLALRRKLPLQERVAQHQAIPGPVEYLCYALRILRFGFVRILGSILPAIGNDAPFILRAGKGSLQGINPSIGIDLPPFGDAFCADPFLIEKEGEVFCFYEEFPYDTGLGKIAVATLSDEGADRLGEALTADHHLSFPFVFEHDGETYLMPETMGIERIEIWRSTAFPLGWELHTTAFEGKRLADPVLFRQGSTWWLFANVSHDSFGDFSSELHVYMVDGPDLQKILPHPMNPVVVGSDVARGGGRVFESDGRIYRYSQDNSGNIYGYGLNLMEITELSETGYEEHRVAHYSPDNVVGIAGCHHADAAAGRFIMDVRVR